MIKPSTDYKLIERGKVIAEGSKKKMTKLRNEYKKAAGKTWYRRMYVIYLAPSLKVGDKLDHDPSLPTMENVHRRKLAILKHFK